jgi:hypothetical protein
MCCKPDTAKQRNLTWDKTHEAQHAVLELRSTRTQQRLCSWVGLTWDLHYVCLTGAKSPLAQFITSWVVGFVLLFLTQVFSKLPYNVLGAVVIAGVAGLLDYEQVRG